MSRKNNKNSGKVETDYENMQANRLTMSQAHGHSTVGPYSLYRLSASQCSVKNWKRFMRHSLS